MITIDEYKKNPCRISAIPYWKNITYQCPNHISVVHDAEYHLNRKQIVEDKQYFRIKHALSKVELCELDYKFEFCKVETEKLDDLEKVVALINRCYLDIQVDLQQVIHWTKSKVFNGSLWIFIIDIEKQIPVALGIAEIDHEVREGMLEWIQVLPEYHNRKLGRALVTKLLSELKPVADFVTVSGQVENETNPERLYRRCGFEGNDIWHVLRCK